MGGYGCATPSPSQGESKPSDIQIARVPQTFQRLMIAQDTGNAIKGRCAVMSFGIGDGALAIAGRMNSQGRYWILVPIKASNNLSRHDKN